MINKIKELFKKKKKEKESKSFDYDGYNKLLTEVMEKIPADVISKEITLRKKELNLLNNFINTQIRNLKISGIYGLNKNEDGVSYFLNKSYGKFLDENYTCLAYTDFWEYMKKDESEAYNRDEDDEWIDIFSEEFYPKFNSLYKSIKTFISEKKLQCIKKIDEDGDKYDCIISAYLCPSEEFISEARKYGYLSASQFSNK